MVDPNFAFKLIEISPQRYTILQSSRLPKQAMPISIAIIGNVAKTGNVKFFSQNSWNFINFCLKSKEIAIFGKSRALFFVIIELRVPENSYHQNQKRASGSNTYNYKENLKISYHMIYLWRHIALKKAAWTLRSTIELYMSR